MTFEIKWMIENAKTMNCRQTSIMNINSLSRCRAALLVLCCALLPVQMHADKVWQPAEIGSGAYRLKPDTTQVYKTVELDGEAVALHIHAFLPEGYKTSDKRPAAVFFHGGGWHGGTPDHFYPQARYLALRGMVAFSVEYRTIKRFQNSPKECVADGKSAMRWVRAHAAELGVDPSRIAAGGGSAGGHIAAATALTEGFNEPGEDTTVSCVPDVLLLFNPVFDNGPDGFAHSLVQPYWQAISPAEHIDEQAPPTVVILGTADEIIPVSTIERYKQRMEAAGRRCDLHLYEAQPHGFYNIWVSRDFLAETMIVVDRFLVSLGYLQGEPLFDEAESN